MRKWLLYFEAVALIALIVLIVREHKKRWRRNQFTARITSGCIH